MFKKTPYQFKDKVTVDFLQSTYMDHQQIAEDLALSEIHSLELAMPTFNTVASLNKREFNKLLLNIRRKVKDTQTFTVMVAAISDTFTCMIQNNKFYDNFTGDNKIGLDLMIDLLQTLKLIFVTYRKTVETKHLETLIDILEKSAGRIQNETEYYETMQQIILALKTHLQLNKENKIEVNIKMKTKIEPKVLTGDRNKENAKLQLTPFTDKKVLNNNNVKSNVDCEINCAIMEDKNPPKKSAQEQVLEPAPLKPQINNKKPANAFELMMMSSKKRAVKRKSTM